MIPPCIGEETTYVFTSCTELISLTYEPVGRWFEACQKRQRSEESVSIIEDLAEKQEIDDDDNEELSESDKSFMLSLNAKEWKKQDHYRVLGISNIRWQVTDEDVKRAYRKKVLKYHPDKKKTQTTSHLPPGLNVHDYFTCITKAYETLSTVQGRQEYDSIDPSFDDTIPSFSSKQNFFKVFTPVFEMNSRWSKLKPVPLLSDMNSSQEDVNSFYAFWYDFQSWRTFSYLDEEEKGENREERRWIERENRRTRQKKKKEEIQRVRGLVDLAYQNDPRLKKFKDEEKQRKLELKLAKDEAEKEKEMQRLQTLKEERKLREEAEQEAKEKASKDKKEKDKVKKAAARDRKIIRQAIKDHNFFSLDVDEVSSLERLEKSMENLSLQSLQELREAVELNDKAKLKELYYTKSTETLEKIKQENEALRKKEEKSVSTLSKQSSSQSDSSNVWSDEELKLLVKASQLFAVGTASRWAVIMTYINEHSSSVKKKTEKQVINKVKNLKKHDPGMKEDVNRNAFKNFENSSQSKMANPTEKTTKVDTGIKSPSENPSISWSSDEQKLLEQALKTYGSSTPERWEKIASVIPTRSKKDCMRRYKELVEMVKSKKINKTAST